MHVFKHPCMLDWQTHGAMSVSIVISRSRFPNMFIALYRLILLAISFPKALLRFFLMLDHNLGVLYLVIRVEICRSC